MTTRGPAKLARIKLCHPLRTPWQDADRSATPRRSAIVHAATKGDLETRPAGPEHPRSRRGALARDITDWQIDIRPARVGICTAYWCSPDGRSRDWSCRGRSSAELVARLRAMGPVPS